MIARRAPIREYDIGGNLNARIVHRAMADGIYRVRATSYNGGRGAFTLTVRPKG
jgi:hypothetical protein